MANSTRFRDWTDLPSASRQRKRAGAVHYARALEPRLNAFIAFRDAGADFAADILDGIPYAAKDIFFAPDRRPTGGLAKSLLKIPPFHADVLRCLDDAGGCCVDYTSMTELAKSWPGRAIVEKSDSEIGRLRNIRQRAAAEPK